MSNSFTRTFVNEIGNNIIVEVHSCDSITEFGTKFQSITITMIGPTSEVQNTITMEEAIHLSDLLNQILDKKTY